MSAFPPWPELRTLIEEPSFAEAREAIVGNDIRRFDEMLSAITWEIARDPEHAPAVPGSRLRLARSEAMPGEPILRVYYTINDDGTCSLWDVNLADVEAEEE